jgi:hypothetical protein
MSQESETALPIRGEVIITDGSPRFLEKDAPDSPVELKPIKVTVVAALGVVAYDIAPALHLASP